MKNLIKNGFILLSITISLTACDFFGQSATAEQATTNQPDSLTIDSLKQDTTQIDTTQKALNKADSTQIK
ncbi:hypothetical protein [Pedobacter sp. MW01-1-1]|uniref:hypothetical protein n=1 Tax=Pedobacter sp. MW01-1-1 TaxID=3383027 RepID=UPI003FEE464F